MHPPENIARQEENASGSVEITKFWEYMRKDVQTDAEKTGERCTTLFPLVAYTLTGGGGGVKHDFLLSKREYVNKTLKNDVLRQHLLVETISERSCLLDILEYNYGARNSFQKAAALPLTIPSQRVNHLSAASASTADG